jgi:hypothetical protein
MRDDNPATRILLSTLAGYGDGYVSYRPKLNAVTGSALGSIFLVRLLWRWEAQGRQPFHRFSDRAPDHDQYRPGQSWCEELQWSRREFDTAVGAVSTRLPSGQGVLRYYEQEARQGVVPRLMVIRWQDGAHRMWWEVIEPAVGRLLAPIYLRWEDPPAKSAPAAARQRPLLDEQAAAALGSSTAGPDEAVRVQKWLMGVLKQVTGTYGSREREAKAAKQLAAQIIAGEFTRECARDALIDLRDDTGWTGPKGWNEVRIRMTSYLPRWLSARAQADEDEAERAPRPAAAGGTNGAGRGQLRAVPVGGPSVQVPPAGRRPAAGVPRVDRDEELLGSRDYKDLDR